MTDPPPGTGPVRRTTYRTTDPDEARAFLDRMYTAHPARPGAFDRTSPMSLSQVSAGGLSHVDVTMPPDLTLRLDGTDDLSVTTVVAGGTRVEKGRATEHYRAGDAFLGSFPGAAYLVRCRELRAGVVTVPAAALDRAAGALPGGTRAPVRFGSLSPTSPAAGERWKRAAAFARRILDDDQTAAGPLILSSTTRLLAATALAVFPSNLLPDHGTAGEAAVAPDTLRRAEDFLHGHAQDDIGLADLAAACRVTPRALQYAFARHHGMSPTRYLRRVRLARAHQDLVDADPGDGVTVTAVAVRWGFAHPGRFAAAYRNAYGRSPSTTLRT